MEGMIKVCGLWKGQKNEAVLSGKLTYSSRLVVLPNRYKEKEADPDYEVFIAKNERREAPQDGGVDGTGASF